jgi:hypothetical protein
MASWNAIAFGVVALWLAGAALAGDIDAVEPMASAASVAPVLAMASARRGEFKMVLIELSPLVGIQFASG